MRKAIILIAILCVAAVGCGKSGQVNDDEVNGNWSSVNGQHEAEKKKLVNLNLPEVVNMENEPVVNEEEKEVDAVEMPEPDIEDAEISEQEIELPEFFDQEITFVPQAPYAKWDELHKEACEEAAVIIAAKHLLGEKLDKEIMEEEISKLVEWQNEKFGKWKDTTAAETAQMINEYYGLPASLLHDPKEDDIKKELVQGNLVIAPTAGRMLDNPYFTAPGPVYHMLVVRGYDQTHFITNDPGTKRGEAYKYTYINLLGSIHDWNEENIRLGKRVVIVVENR